MPDAASRCCHLAWQPGGRSPGASRVTAAAGWPRTARCRGPRRRRGARAASSGAGTCCGAAGGRTGGRGWGRGRARSGSPCCSAAPRTACCRAGTPETRGTVYIVNFSSTPGVSHCDGLHVPAAAAAAAPVLAVLAALALDGDQPRPARVPAPRPAPAPGAVRQQRDGDAVSAAGAVHQSAVSTEVT